MSESSGGLNGGGEEPHVVDSYTGELISSEKGVWNDHTWSWETVVLSRVEKAYGLVQQRRGYAEFSRQYESYVANAGARDNARGLLSGTDDPAADS